MRPSSLQFPSSGSGNKGADAGLEDSLEQLLEDARRMKEEDGGGSGDSAAGGLLSDEEGTGLKEIIRNVLSTIVTADFFVVCGFLLWFLAGIFWRAVFDDDSVQIAFNSEYGFRWQKVDEFFRPHDFYFCIVTVRQTTLRLWSNQH